MLKNIITGFFTNAVLVVGIPFSLLGIGFLSDTRATFDRGVICLGIAATVWVLSLSWFQWASRHELPSRFSLRTLMIVVSLVALALGFMGAVLLAP